MKAMKYEQQVICCFDEDLWEHADLLQIKRRLTEDAEKSATLELWKGGFQGAVPTVDLPYMSRLVLVGHGVKQGSQARYLFSKRDVAPQALAKLCHHILSGSKINRISLHMRCGGGDVGDRGTPGTDPSTWYISPEKSFAAELASYCGPVADWISARTNDVRPARFRLDGAITAVQREVGPAGKTRHHGEVDAQRMFVWKVGGELKAALA